MSTGAQGRSLLQAFQGRTLARLMTGALLPRWRSAPNPERGRKTWCDLRITCPHRGGNVSATAENALLKITCAFHIFWTLAGQCLITWLLGLSIVPLSSIGNTVLYPSDGPSIWCTTFKWQDEINGAMVITEGQKLNFKMTAYSTGCDCGKHPRCNRLENAFCSYSYAAECSKCYPCKVYSSQNIVFFPRNSGHPKLLKLDGVATQVTENIDIASCKVNPGTVQGNFVGYCWYSNSQASLQPFYTYILTAGGAIMESIVWTTLMAGAVSVSVSTADWMSLNNTFQVGDKAMLRVTQRDSYSNPVSSSTVLKVDCFQFTGFVASDARAKVAVASEVVKYECDKSGDGTGYIYWYPSKIGKFWLQVGNGGTNIRGSPFPFEVNAGPISIKSCTAFWPNLANTFIAGNTSTLRVLQKDIRGNAYTSKPYSFITRASTRASGIYVPLIFDVKLAAFGVQLISFTPTQAGEFNLYVGNVLEQISGSPFLFRVLPGEINVSSCTGVWKYTQEFGAGDEAQFLVTQRDSYGNIVGLQNGRGDIINLNASILTVGGNLTSTKLAASVDFVTGIQTIHFNPTLSGSFNLSIGKGSQTIQGSPFGFTVSTGPISVAACKSQWLDNQDQFKAGATATLIVIVTDKYGNEFNISFPFIVNVHLSSGLKASNVLFEVHYGSDESYTTVDMIVKEAGSYYLTIGTKKEFISNSPLSFTVTAASLSIPNCVAEWNDDTNVFKAGGTAVLKILEMDAFGNNISYATGVFNQSSYYITEIIDVSSNEQAAVEVSQVTKPSVGYHYIRLNPKVSGNFLLYVGSGRRSLAASPFAFVVTAGPLSLSNSFAFWERNVSELRAGAMASLYLWTKDTFNNIINASTQENMRDDFLLQVTYSSLPMSEVGQDLNISIDLDKIRGCWLITFWPKILGEFFLQVGTEDGNFSNSPLAFTVDSGLLSLRHSSGGWEDDINEFQPPGTARFYLTLKDSAGNILNESYASVHNISIQVYDDSNAPLAIPDMGIDYLQNVSQYIISFSLNQIGQFILAIGKGPDYLEGSPFRFYYIAGEVDASKTNISGKGLDNSTAGDISEFTVQLHDSHGNPTGASNTSISVSILRFGDPLELPKNITNSATMIGFYRVIFSAKVAGQYAITIRWRGVTLHSGPALYKTVFPGPLYLPNTIALGSGVERGVAGSFLDFTVFFRDALNNSNPMGQADVRITFSPDTLASRDISKANTTTRVKYRITIAPLTPYYISIVAVISNFSSPVPGSPFQVYIESGNVSTLNSLGEWVGDRSIFEVDTQAEFLITPRDTFGNEMSQKNIQPCNCNFSAQVYKAGSTAPVVVRDMLIVPLANSSAVKQRLTFSLQETGDYLLQVGNVSVNILGSPFTFSYVTGLPNKNTSTFTGSGLRDSYAGDILSFLMKARDKSGNPVVADKSLLNVTLYSNYSPALKVNASLVQGYPGTFVITYKTTIAGNYTILVRLMSVFLYEGHKNVFAGLVNMSQSEVSGFGLSSLAAVNTTNSIVAYLVDSYRNPRSVLESLLSLTISPSTSNISQNFVNIDVGKYQAFYKVEKPGLYNITVKYNRTHFRGSPLEVIVTSDAWGVRPERCDAKVIPATASVGERMYALIEVRDVNGDYFVSHVKLNFALDLKPRVSENSFTYSLANQDNGTFLAAFELYVSGTYKLLISLFGTPIKDNPYAFNVVPGPIDVSACVAYGEGLFRAMAGTPQIIMLEARDRFQNIVKDDDIRNKTSEFYMKVSGESIDTTFQFKWVSIGRYEGTYILLETGHYNLAIQYQGKDIYGSPFSVTVVSDMYEVPKFTSYPYILLAFEGVPYMIGSSLQAIQISFADPSAMVSVDLKVQHGYLFPSSEMPFNWEGVKGGKPKFDGTNYTLSFSGIANSVNKALRAFTYQGVSHYNGEDFLVCSVVDKKGAGDILTVNVTIKAVNDPPYIVAADYVYLNPLEVSQNAVEIQLQNFSVGDFDHFDKRDDMELLEVEISLEVEIGTIAIVLSSLPAVTAASRQGHEEWKHIGKIVDANSTVKMTGQGINFHASITDANSALETLSYSIGPLKEKNFKDILQIIVNDQGNFGCYGNCSSDISVPLFSTARIFIVPSRLQNAKLDRTKVSLISTFTVVGALMAIVFGFIWYKWSKRIHIKVEELEEVKATKQKFYDPLWIPEQEELDES
ncbi:hypothetical protein GOP47_0016800 [Adiantum capillus-veneris]|uniref:GEX2 N-terminal Ig-like domain-containing protein n=1 Tax=Adiantum capillus-veneris TaxID=13818 RepID=A0A9D4ZCF5_ADICA|nr:hypothetical protein GOP47_0016800 [Adiantum capillus-veneris]